MVAAVTQCEIRSGQNRTIAKSSQHREHSEGLGLGLGLGSGFTAGELHRILVATIVNEGPGWPVATATIGYRAHTALQGARLRCCRTVASWSFIIPWNEYQFCWRPGSLLASSRGEPTRCRFGALEFNYRPHQSCDGQSSLIPTLPTCERSARA